MPAILVDTSCLIAVTHLQKLDLLNELYDGVTITEEVRSEYSCKYEESLPVWIHVKSVGQQRSELDRSLDPGEASLIRLAMELPGSLLVLDEWKARTIAKRNGLPVTGTIGVLLEAKAQGLISAIAPLFKELRATDFRFSAALERTSLLMAGEC